MGFVVEKTPCGAFAFVMVIGTLPVFFISKALVTDVPTKTVSRQTVNIVNTGTTVAKITGVTLPANAQLKVDPATVPVVGKTIQPLASIAVSMTFSPTSASPVADTLVVTSDRGKVTVKVAATAVSGAAHLEMPRTLDFGDVPAGTSVTRAFEIKNTGNVPMTITKAKAPQGVFSTTNPISEGLKIPAGETAFQTVTFAPTAVGQAGTSETFYLITADDGQAAKKVMLTGNGTDDPIAAYGWKINAGRPGSSLGRSLTAEYAVGVGKCQDYTRGVICWSPKTGAHAVLNEIYKRYRAEGGAGGPFGFPTSDEKVSPDKLGKYSDFSGAGGTSIYYSPTTGAHSVTGAIRSKWRALGAETGPLGYPITDEKGTPDGVGRYNHFSGAGGASIYWTPTTKAHSVTGEIRAKWASLGWEKGLGYPTTDTKASADKVGQYNHFAGSGTRSIVWSPKTGAHVVQGAIRAKWIALGAETGALGYPITDEKGTPDKKGAYNHFSGSNGSSIYYSPATGAHAVQGVIRAKWASLGWETSRLGYPTSDQRLIPTGRVSEFQHGRLTWDRTTKKVTG